MASIDNQLETSLLPTCNRFVANKLLQAMRTHPDIGFLVKSVARCQHTCCKLRVFVRVTRLLIQLLTLHCDIQLLNDVNKLTRYESQSTVHLHIHSFTSVRKRISNLREFPDSSLQKNCYLGLLFIKKAGQVLSLTYGCEITF